MKWQMLSQLALVLLGQWNHLVKLGQVLYRQMFRPDGGVFFVLSPHDCVDTKGWRGPWLCCIPTVIGQVCPRKSYSGVMFVSNVSSVRIITQQHLCFWVICWLLS